MIYTALDNFYLTDEQLASPPSVSEGGIDLETEFKLRLFGAELIQEGGILLKTPQAVMATGQVLLHRFYCKKSFTKYPVKRVSCACLWMATKLEETPRKLRDILQVFLRMECRREQLPLELLDYFSKRYDDLKADMIRLERLLLREFGFIVHVEHPHKLVLNYLQILDKQHLMQDAWSLVNDSLRTPLCVRFSAEVVACGVIYLAARRKQEPLPEEPGWWGLFNVEKKDLEEVCWVICGLYKMPKAVYIHVVDNDKPLSQCCFTDPGKPRQLSGVKQQAETGGADSQGNSPNPPSSQEKEVSAEKTAAATTPEVDQQVKAAADQPPTTTPELKPPSSGGNSSGGAAAGGESLPPPSLRTPPPDVDTTTAKPSGLKDKEKESADKAKDKEAGEESDDGTASAQSSSDSELEEERRRREERRREKKERHRREHHRDHKRSHQTTSRGGEESTPKRRRRSRSRSKERSRKEHRHKSSRDPDREAKRMKDRRPSDRRH